MASQTPPPYFPQGSLAPADPNRYRKFKIIMGAIVLALILLIAGAGIGIYYAVESFF